MIEDERAKVLGVERLILETICFKFGVEVGLNGVVKIGRALGREFSEALRPSCRCSFDPRFTRCPRGLEISMLSADSQSTR
jgi:CTD kinase subunit beta